MRARTSVEIKTSNINKLLKQVELKKISLKDADINRRIQKLREESEIGSMWADDLQRKYVELMKRMNS